MNLNRYLRDDLVDLDFRPDLPELDPEMSAERRLWVVKEAVLVGLASLLSRGGRVGSERKLQQDLLFREKKATTAVGMGVAIPHIRTLQAKELVLAVAICREGVEFDSIDGAPVRLFVPMVTPPYEDKIYLRVLKRLAEMFADETFLEEVLAVEEPGEVIRLLTRHT